jgi:hypothetical protein
MNYAIQRAAHDTNRAPSQALFVKIPGWSTSSQSARMHYTSNFDSDGFRPALRFVVRENEKTWFASWARQWKNDTAGFSSINRKVSHPAYQAILRMRREAAIPLILKELEKETAHWFPALKKLSAGYDPVPPHRRGDVEAMRQAWLAWGRDQGFLT